MNRIKKYFTGISRDVYFLTLASFFGDISTEMLYPVLPIFLTQTLKAGGGVVGIVEGVAEATKNIIQGFSGYLSDKFQRRKTIALIGFAFSAIAKPLIGVATVWQGVLGARFLDRLGSGSRSAPRDALIASSVRQEYRGKAFGLEGVGDNLGAFLGPLIAILLFFLLHINIRHLFYLAIIPGLMAVLMVAMVTERRPAAQAKAAVDLRLTRFPKTYWKYLAVTGIFGIGNSSNLFLILQIKNAGASLEITIFIYAFYNLVAALISYPSGFWSDKFGRKPMLLVSFIIFLISYLGFALTRNIFLIGILFIFYGLYQGIFRTVGKSFATDLTPPELRASGVGWYSTVVGLSALVASIIAGQLWDKVSHPAVFLYGVAFSLIGLLAFVIFIPNNK
ncbi:MFS transporter [Candidatus Roizmanbacteria bacterium]|nr:MFS transporter [Candidatus Roizmanbacteria bacterium]